MQGWGQMLMKGQHCSKNRRSLLFVILHPLFAVVVGGGGGGGGGDAAAAAGAGAAVVAVAVSVIVAVAVAAGVVGGVVVGSWCVWRCGGWSDVGADMSQTSSLGTLLLGQKLFFSSHRFLLCFPQKSMFNFRATLCHNSTFCTCQLGLP